MSDRITWTVLDTTGTLIVVDFRYVVALQRSFMLWKRALKRNNVPFHVKKINLKKLLTFAAAYG
ncbi:MAG: hypothetical protein EAZ39_31395 [Oscillatoriales cyanobacterium]|nr:MAG: hypothetical protein EAZ39_31395 [Oscillatoriales cyanobacterium]